MGKLKQVKLKGLSDVVEVNEDGTDIRFKGRKVNTHLVKTTKNGEGYYACSIENRNFYVHRIVAEAFIPNTRPIVNKYVLHKTTDITNNHHTNLVWGNGRDLHAKNTKNGVIGGEKYRGRSPIPYEEAIKIAKRLDNGEFAKDICKEYNVSEMSIARIRKKYCQQKVASVRYDKDIKATVYKLAGKYDAPQIAKMTGLQYHTVYRWLKQKEEGGSKPAFYY